MGSAPDRIMDYTIISDTTNAPQQTISSLAQAQTWWTVRAYDQYGSTIYADPRLIRLPENGPPVADTGPHQVPLYAGLDGKATVTLSGSRSTDPDGDALSYTWAWAIGTKAYLSNGVSLTIKLPVGVRMVQLMVNDGHANSQPDGVKVIVVGPVECEVKITPPTINLRSHWRYILASIRFPRGFTKAEAGSDEPLLLYPGGIQAARWWTVGAPCQPSEYVCHALIRALFLVSVHNGRAELTVAGRPGAANYFTDVTPFE